MPSLSVRFATYSLCLALIACGGLPEDSTADGLFTAQNGAFTCQQPPGSEIQEQYRDGEFAVAFTDSFGNLYRIDGMTAGQHNYADTDLENILGTALEVFTLTSFRANVPDAEVVTKEWVPDHRDGALFAVVSMPGGSTLSRSVNGGAPERMDAVRSALLFIEPPWFVQLSVQLTPTANDSITASSPDRLLRLQKATITFSDSISFGGEPSEPGPDQDVDNQAKSLTAASSAEEAMRELPDGYQGLRFDDAFQEMLIRSMPLLVAFPDNYEVFPNEPSFGKWLWTTRQCYDELQETLTAPFDQGLFLAYISLSVGYDRGSNGFICGPGCDEAKILSDLRQSGHTNVSAERHLNNGIPIWLVRATTPETEQVPSLELRFAYLATLIDTNVVMVSYRPCVNASDKGESDWQAFRRALLTSFK